MGGEHVMDKPGADARNFVRRDGCADSAAAQCHGALNSAGGNRPRQRNDEVGVIVSTVEVRVLLTSEAMLAISLSCGAVPCIFQFPAIKGRTLAFLCDLTG
jgi:hypothetical protein